METSDTEENRTSENVQNSVPANRNNPDDEFNFDAYDDEEANQVAAISDIAAIDPNEHLSDADDSEAEDDVIKPSDNLVLVGHVDDDAASLEVYGKKKIAIINNLNVPPSIHIFWFHFWDFSL